MTNQNRPPRNLWRFPGLAGIARRGYNPSVPTKRSSLLTALFIVLAASLAHTTSHVDPKVVGEVQIIGQTGLLGSTLASPQLQLNMPFNTLSPTIEPTRLFPLATPSVAPLLPESGLGPLPQLPLSRITPNATPVSAHYDTVVPSADAEQDKSKPPW